MNGAATLRPSSGVVAELTQTAGSMAAAVTAYDPAFDTDGHVAAAACRLSSAIAQGAAEQTRPRDDVDGEAG